MESGLSSQQSDQLNLPTVRELRRVTTVVYTAIGAMNGLFLYVWGPYFMAHFSVGDASAAITITMILFAMRQALVALLEVPAGALADTIGRGHVVILAMVSRSVFFLSLAAISFCTQLYSAVCWGVLASIGYAVAYTFFNGAYSAWCADRLRTIAPAVPYAWISTRYTIYESIGEVIGAVLSITLYVLHFPFLIFFGGAVLAYGMMGYCFNRMPGSGTKARERGALRLAAIMRTLGDRVADSILVCRRHPVLLWVTLVFGAYGFLMSLVVHLWPVYLHAIIGADQLGVEWISIAVIGLVLQGVGGWWFSRANDRRMGRAVDNRARFIYYRRVYVSTSILCAVSIGTLSTWQFFGNPPLWLFAGAVGVTLFVSGWIWSCYDIFTNSFVSSDFSHARATVLSAGSMTRSVLTLILAVPAGGLSAEHSPIGWMIPALVLLVAATGAHVMLRRDERTRLATTLDQELPSEPLPAPLVEEEAVENAPE